MENKPRLSFLKGHALLMIACCAIPLVAIAGAALLGVGLQGIGFFAMLLLCPLIHILMMRTMQHGQGSGKQPSEPACHSSQQRDRLATTSASKTE